MPGVTGPTGPAGFDPDRYTVTPSTHATTVPDVGSGVTSPTGTGRPARPVVQPPPARPVGGALDMLRRLFGRGGR